MNDFASYRKSAIRYWERRRIGYNVLLIPSALLGYCSAAMRAAIDDATMQFGWWTVLLMFIVHALAANYCFSLVYAAEFIFGTEDPRSLWKRWMATAVFTTGTLLSIPLAVIGGSNIGNIVYGFMRLF